MLLLWVKVKRKVEELGSLLCWEGSTRIGGPKEAWMDGNRWGVKDIH